MARIIFLCLLMAGCAGATQYDKEYKPKEVYLRSLDRVHQVCMANSPGCQFFFRGSKVCQVYAWKDAPNLAQILRHENAHCNGY